LNLIEKIKNPNSILLYHCDNHYSLIGGFRIFEMEGKIYRQILGSRFGQRMKHWIDFEMDWEFYSNKKQK
jgi:hypothetical protein